MQRCKLFGIVPAGVLVPGLPQAGDPQRNQQECEDYGQCQNA